LVINTNSDPNAAPIASAGVSIPLTPPARKNTAVKSVLRTRITAALANVIP
jgi:hypothetical protein